MAGTSNKAGYLEWKRETVADLSPESIAGKYAEGFVFTRLGKGVMIQTRSVRIDLSRFELTSENRRILKKTDGLSCQAVPIPVRDYDWKIAKMAKDFYDAKSGPSTMSAQKIKEMLTEDSKSGFNSLFIYSREGSEPGTGPLGYAICYCSAEMLHYSYPFL